MSEGLFLAAHAHKQPASRKKMVAMKHEYEAKFLDIDVTELQVKLTDLGATQAFPRTRLTRKIFENDALDAGQWIRLRDEGTRSTLTLKHVTDATRIDGTTEIETEVGDLHAMAEILHGLGLREVRYQENYREEWRLGEVVFDFDTWPDLPTFVEIEGPDEASVRQAAALLDLDYSTARFGSVDEIYRTESGRDILAEATLLFADPDTDRSEAAVAGL
ncbi:adenylate cyclase [Streptomyces turgidiscabies Car8]|uniref:Adenylate cyclase n=2 Tax=Streptomyces TaxID=1883 RepID=L7F8C1_STRT8|nr:adenylate cyclase [Streptomyces turgidiscabies Car8]